MGKAQIQQGEYTKGIFYLTTYLEMSKGAKDAADVQKLIDDAKKKL